MKDDDIIVWPDGTWCFAHELPEMSHKSDDYRRVPFDSKEAERIVARTSGDYLD